MFRLAHQSGKGLNDHIIGRVIGLWAGPAKPCQCAIDQLRLDCRNGFVAKSKLFQCVTGIVLHQHIRCFDQASQHIASGLVLQIESDGAFACVLSLKIGAVRGVVQSRHETFLAGHVRVVRWLDLDHVCAKNSKLVSAERSCQHMGQFQDLDTFERSHDLHSLVI